MKQSEKKVNNCARRLAAQNEAIHARACAYPYMGMDTEYIYPHIYAYVYCNTYAGVGMQVTLRFMRACCCTIAHMMKLMIAKHL